MHKRDRNRSLAYARCHTLNRAVANVTHDKDAGNIGFQKPGLAIEFPTVGPLAVAYELRAGLDESELIALDDVCKPIGIRRCADHDE